MSVLSTSADFAMWRLRLALFDESRCLRDACCRMTFPVPVILTVSRLLFEFCLREIGFGIRRGSRRSLARDNRFRCSHRPGAALGFHRRNISRFAERSATEDSEGLKNKVLASDSQHRKLPMENAPLPKRTSLSSVRFWRSRSSETADQGRSGDGDRSDESPSFSDAPYEVATAALSPADIAAPPGDSRPMQEHRVILAEVKSVNVAAKTINLGDRK